MPKVYNKHHHNAPADAVYVGRPTKWGNPFVIGRDGNREQVIEKYREWIYQPEQAHLREDAKRELRGRDTICWCVPAACHSPVLMEIANACCPAGPDEGCPTSCPDCAE